MQEINLSLAAACVYRGHFLLSVHISVPVLCCTLFINLYIQNINTHFVIYSPFCFVISLHALFSLSLVFFLSFCLSLSLNFLLLSVCILSMLRKELQHWEHSTVLISLFPLVEPKVYVSAGSTALVDGGNESVAATCIAERSRPAAEVSWETELFGRSEVQIQDEPNGTYTTQVRYVLEPRRHSQGHTLTCVVRHPALQTEIRIPYVLNVQFAPEVTVVGYDQNWFVGQENVKLDCGAKANPPAHHFSWTRLDGPMPDGVDIVNNTFSFTRPLERNDSGLYRCEVYNDIGPRSHDVHIWIQDPPPTTTPVPTTSTPLFLDTSMAPNKRRGASGHFTSPTLASLSDSSMGTIVGGAVGGVLLLGLLLILGGACFMRQRRTFRGDYYTKQYLGPSDMQKESQLDVLQPHELQEVDGDAHNSTCKDSQELKPKPGLGGDIIYPNDIKDREDWGDGHRGLREGSYYPVENHNIHHPKGPLVHTPTVTNGSPYLPEDCYDNGTDSEYVSHMDGSVISRREWYV